MDLKLFNQSISDFSFYYQTVFNELHSVSSDEDKRHIEQYIIELRKKLNNIVKHYKKPKQKKEIEGEVEGELEDFEEGKKKIVKEIKENYNNLYINVTSDVNDNIIYKDIEQLKNDCLKLKKILKSKTKINKKKKFYTICQVK
jgi:soluble cytochrome b562